MVNKFLSAFGAVAIFALLVSFGARDAAPATVLRTPALAISQIPITHHFSQYVGSVGALNGSSGPAYPPLNGTMPAEAGFAISQLTWDGGYMEPVVVKINGAVAFRARLGNGSAGGASYSMIPETITITPPLIVPPGATLQIGIDFNGSIYSNLTITGYTLDAAFFGP